MTTINLLDKYRFENPQYNNIDDDTLLQDIYAKHYSDMNFNDYKDKVLNTEASFNNLANMQKIHMNSEVEYEYCKNSNAIACISPERLKEIKNMKPMGFFEANRGLVSFYEDDDKARFNKISSKYNNNEELNEEEQKFIADFIDYQAQMQIRGITYKGKVLNGIIQNIPNQIQTSIVKAAYDYGLVKAGLVGAKAGASLGGVPGAIAGSSLAVIGGTVAKAVGEPLVQTILMPHQIKAEQTQREFEGIFELTDKGTVFVNKLNKAEEELIKTQAITSTLIENVNEAIWDMFFPYVGSKLSKTKAGELLSKSKLGQITEKVLTSKLGKILNKVEGTKFSGLVAEEWEEIATDIMNNYITEDQTLKQSFNDALDRDWAIELGIIAGTGIITDTTMRGLERLTKNGATSQEKAAFNSLKEEDKQKILTQLNEIKFQQFQQIKNKYKQDLKNITNYTDEQINENMNLYDKVFLYGYLNLNNEDLSVNEWTNKYGFKILDNVINEANIYNQAINNSLELNEEVEILDISKLIKDTPSKENAKKVIWDIAEKGEQIKTLSEPWVVDIINNKDKKKHLLNSSNMGNFNRKQYNRRNIELNSLKDIVNNSILVERVDNKKLDKKPNVEEYFYFYTPIKDGKNTYLIKTIAEKLKGEKDLKNVHLYDMFDNQLNLSGKPETSQDKLPSINSIDKLTIKQILENVKDINGKNALESYIEENGNIYNQQQQNKILGQYDVRDKIIRLSKESNITTFQHEMMHWWRQVLELNTKFENFQGITCNFYYMIYICIDRNKKRGENEIYW